MTGTSSPDESDISAGLRLVIERELADKTINANLLSPSRSPRNFRILYSREKEVLAKLLHQNVEALNSRLRGETRWLASDIRLLTHWHKDPHVVIESLLNKPLQALLPTENSSEGTGLGASLENMIGMSRSEELFALARNLQEMANALERVREGLKSLDIAHPEEISHWPHTLHLLLARTQSYYSELPLSRLILLAIQQEIQLRVYSGTLRQAPLPGEQKGRLRGVSARQVRDLVNRLNPSCRATSRQISGALSDGRRKGFLERVEDGYVPTGKKFQREPRKM